MGKDPEKAKSNSTDANHVRDFALAIVITGPTASGKTSLSIRLAKYIKDEFALNAEIISADSRQVYKGLDIGTGKIKPDEMNGIPHHLIDILDPNERYSVGKFTKDASQLIRDIKSRGNIAIICGGTGFYIDSLVRGIEYPEVKQGQDSKINDLDTPELYELLKQKDPARAAKIDPHNRRRIERALSLADASGTVAPLKSRPPEDIHFIQIGITAEDKLLREQIAKRLKTRLDEGMIDEVLKLHENGLSWERMGELGLEYRYVSDYLQGKIKDKGELQTKLEQKIWQYARRQKTWFKRIENIKWFKSTPNQPINDSEIFTLVANWLRSN